MLHVLIVEPQAQTGAAIGGMVKEMGHHVVGIAGSRKEAEARMNQGWPTLIVTDMLPGGEGLQLVREVQEQRIPVMTVVLSDRFDFDSMRQAMLAGAIDYLAKPVQREDVRLAVQRAERRMAYFHGAHREFVRAERYFEQLEYLRPAEVVQGQAEILQEMLTFEESRPGERIGLLRMLHAKWHQRLSRHGLTFEEPFVGDNAAEAASYFQKLGELWTARAAAPVGSQVKLSVKRACDFLREHYREEYPLAEISAKYGMSVSHFSTQIKKYTGCSYVTYVNRLRIDRAKELLLEPEWKVYEVAGEVGYATLPYFNKVFKQLVGMTPGDYRKTLGL